MTAAHAGELTALASLPGVGPARLRVLLDCWEPVEAWARVAAGTALREPAVAAALGRKAAEIGSAWRAFADATDPADLVRHCDALGCRVLTADDAEYPSAFRSDPEPPAVIWTFGDLAALGAPAVGVVGTRNCTRYGHDVARSIGRELAEAGVAIVSGLALGIDAAAHRGALEAITETSARPIGVVGSGLDVVYPRRNRALWEAVADRGLLVSEAPPGTVPDAWRFPARNRLIAGLSNALVVVESAERGGSMHTVDEAMRRDVDVLAVPGPITSPVSSGTNRLIADGAMPMLSGDDVLIRLGFQATTGETVPRRAETAESPPEDPESAAVLHAIGAGAASLSDLADHLAMPFDRLTLVVTRLEAAGRLHRTGGWYEASRGVAPQR